MQVVGNNVFVGFGRRLYRWTTTRREKTKPVELIEDVEFHVVPQQSTFMVSAQKTELKHLTRGGEAPYEFFLVTQLDGITLNDTTGIATIDRDVLLQAAVPTLSKSVAGTSNAAEASLKLQETAINFMEPVVKTFGRKPKGFPVAVPIRFKATDNVGKVAEMQYFVLMEVPIRQLTGVLQDYLEKKRGGR
jgi:hypothetical protein